MNADFHSTLPAHPKPRDVKCTDGCVTVRDRDTMKQERVAIADLKAYFEEKFDF